MPGDGGTQLWANLTGKPSTPHYFCSKTTSDYFDMWLNLQLFTPYVIDCWIDNMKCVGRLGNLFLKSNTRRSNRKHCV